ncbi:hypothetical protein ISG33_02035 [Glaciecola sp. MH2013]|uniref:hypothetical protein n=1 Tax=Glaciecola sp. MH2013 TaxID=2785524 RepID=UPI00189CDECD|nr:hypothetical protein [Glaciecola sp. MH2013]MBF7072181.1 hypothetical protein [Glaciecola sp. MH2013]
MKIKSLLVAATLGLAAFGALATPQYSGNTYGQEISNVTPANGGDLATTLDYGYYIWNDELAPKNWSIRWTGNGAAESTPTWAGGLVFRSSSLDTTSLFQYELASNETFSVNYDASFLGGQDAFGWTAITNNSGGVDGIDFTLSDDVELMVFSLGSSLFNNLALTNTDSGNASQHIYIGGGDDYTFGTTNVLVADVNGMKQQSFEIRVSAPGVVAIMGLGLIGLGLSRRRKAK